jgi:hypothetical protein
VATLLILIALVAAGLVLTGGAFILLVRRAEKDLQQHHANVRVLEQMTAPKQDSVVRVERAKHEQRELIEKLLVALEPATAPRQDSVLRREHAKHEQRELVEKLLVALK